MPIVQKTPCLVVFIRPKNKAFIMNHYELLYLIPSQYSETEIEGIHTRVSEFFTKFHAVISKTQFLGKLKLAYPINSVRHGTYVLVYFDADPQAVSDINRSLRLSEEVLRHTIVTVDEKAKDQPCKLEAYTPPIGDDGMPVRKRRGGPVTGGKKTSSPLLPPPVPVRGAETPTLSMEELDKKLDDILDQDFSKDL